MARDRIVDLNDSRLDPFRDLKKSNQNRDANTFIAEGGKLLDRMIDVGWPIVAVLLTPAHEERYRRKILAETPIHLADKPLIEELIGFNFHRGILACGRRPDFPDWTSLIPAIPNPNISILLVDIHDPENVGNIIRTATALGIRSIFLTPKCADPFSRRVLRTSMGGVLLTPLAIIANPAEMIARCRHDCGIQTWGTVLDERAVSLEEATPSARTLIVVGNEGDGLPADCIEACHHHVTIPMAAHADSLNVAVATGIILYHFTQSTK
jgi:tRNA G18 (ribose-2'-O)-methylase SpoU